MWAKTWVFHEILKNYDDSQPLTKSKFLVFRVFMIVGFSSLLLGPDTIGEVSWSLRKTNTALGMDCIAAVDQAVRWLSSDHYDFSIWCSRLESSINSSSVHDRQSIAATNTDARSQWLEAFAMPVCVRILSNKLDALTVTTQDNSGRHAGSAVLYAEQLVACRLAVRALSALIVDGPDPSQPASRAREAKRDFAEYGGISLVCDALRMSLQALHDLKSASDNEARAVPAFSLGAAASAASSPDPGNKEKKPPIVKEAHGVAVSYKDNAAVQAALQLGTDAAWALCWATRWDDIIAPQASTKAAELLPVPGQQEVTRPFNQHAPPQHYLRYIPPRASVPYRIDCALAAGVPAYLVAAVSRWQSAPHVAAACAYVISNIVYKHRAATDAVFRMRGIKCLVGALAGAIQRPKTQPLLPEASGSGAQAGHSSASSKSSQSVLSSMSSNSSTASMRGDEKELDSGAFLQVASNAASALGNLSNTLPEQGPFADRHKAIAAAGAIPLLVRLGDIGDSSARQRAVMTLSNLAQSADTADELLVAGAVALFARVVADADAKAVSADAASTPFATVKAIMGLAFVLGPQIDASSVHDGDQSSDAAVADQSETGSTSPPMQSHAIERTSSLMVSVNAISVIVEQLRGAIAGHKWAGTSAGECFHALQLLALSEHNHSKLITAGLVPCILSVLQDECQAQTAGSSSRDPVAAEHAARCAARLAFSTEGITAILACGGLYEVLHDLGQISSSASARSAAVAAWNVKTHGHVSVAGKTVAQLHDAPVGVHSSSEKHIMLSYSWKYQPLVLALREKLRQAGYTVWVDVEKMAGSKLDAMAHAVENASIVVFTVCSAYFESANCRLEAEYATECGVPMLPIHVQPGYVPRGWLGFIMGSKLWYSIVQPVDITAMFPRLRSAMQAVGVQPVAGRGGAAAAAQVPPMKSRDKDLIQSTELVHSTAAETQSGAQLQFQRFCELHALPHDELRSCHFDLASMQELSVLCAGLSPQERFHFITDVVGALPGHTLRLSAALRGL